MSIILGKLGCTFCVTGSTMIVIHAPKEQSVESIEDLTAMILQPGTVISHFQNPREPSSRRGYS